MFLVRCRSGVSGPRVRSHRDGFGSGEHCGRLGKRRFLNPFRPLLIVWDPTPVGALLHVSGLDGNDRLARHASRDYYIRNGRPSLVLGDDHCHMGGSDDMKSDVVLVKILWIGDFIFMFLGLDEILYIWGYLFIVYVTLLRLIVLYSRCRVNRGTNLFVVLYYVIF